MDGKNPCALVAHLRYNALMLKPPRAALSLAILLIALAAPSLGQTPPQGFDLEAHRGGRNARPENTLAAFRYALDLGVSTLEMDLQVTRDGEVVVSHNAVLEPFLARDPSGRWVDPAHPPLIYGLTLQEVKRYDVGAVNPAYETYWNAHGKFQQASPGERVPTLAEVFELVRRHGDTQVRFNLETKLDPRHPERSPDPYTFVSKVLDVVNRHGMRDRVMLQSFDWRTLLECRRLDKRIPLAALTAEQPAWGASGLYREVGKPGCSPWMAGFDIDDFQGNYVRAAKAIHATVVSPAYKEVTPELVAEAHALGQKLVPWTVNDRRDMTRLIDMGVDGIITDDPALLRQVLQEKGIAVPEPHRTGR